MEEQEISTPISGTPEGTPEGTPVLLRKELKGINIVWGAFGNGEECTGIVEEITNPEEGGIFTKYVGCNYLFKGYPDCNVVEFISVPKKTLVKLTYLLSERVFQLLFGSMFFIFLLLPKSLKSKVIFLLIEFYASITHIAIKRFVLKPDKYCISVQEIGIALTKTFDDLKSEQKKMVLGYIRDEICMMLEYDYAYRARFQDFIPLLNKEDLKKNPKKEILRIIDILIEREVGGMNFKWIRFRKLVNIVLIFKDARDLVAKFLMNLDLEKIKTDEADWYYVLDRDDYNYGGMTRDIRMKIRDELDLKMGNHRPKVIFKKKEV